MGVVGVMGGFEGFDGGSGSVVGGRWEVGGGCFGRVVRSSSLLYTIFYTCSYFNL